MFQNCYSLKCPTDVFQNCYEILQNQPWRRIRSSNYAIDPDGAGGVEPFTVFCDFHRQSRCAVSRVGVGVRGVGVGVVVGWVGVCGGGVVVRCFGGVGAVVWYLGRGGFSGGVRWGACSGGVGWGGFCGGVGWVQW